MYERVHRDCTALPRVTATNTHMHAFVLFAATAAACSDSMHPLWFTSQHLYVGCVVRTDTICKLLTLFVIDARTCHTYESHNRAGNTVRCTRLHAPAHSSTALHSSATARTRTAIKQAHTSSTQLSHARLSMGNCIAARTRSKKSISVGSARGCSNAVKESRPNLYKIQELRKQKHLHERAERQLRRQRGAEADRIAAEQTAARDAAAAVEVKAEKAQEDAKRVAAEIAQYGRPLLPGQLDAITNNKVNKQALMCELVNDSAPVRAPTLILLCVCAVCSMFTMISPRTICTPPVRLACTTGTRCRSRPQISCLQLAAAFLPFVTLSTQGQNQHLRLSVLSWKQLVTARRNALGTVTHPYTCFRRVAA